MPPFRCECLRYTGRAGDKTGHKDGPSPSQDSIQRFCEPAAQYGTAQVWGGVHEAPDTGVFPCIFPILWSYTKRVLIKLHALELVCLLFETLDGCMTTSAGTMWSSDTQDAGDMDHRLRASRSRPTSCAPLTALSSIPCTAAPREQHPV